MVVSLQGAPLADISLQHILETPSVVRAAAAFEAQPALLLDEVCAGRERRRHPRALPLCVPALPTVCHPRPD
jgi:hypothetical protein